MDQTIMLGAPALARTARFPGNPRRRYAYNEAHQPEAETVLDEADYQNDDPGE